MSVITTAFLACLVLLIYLSIKNLAQGLAIAAAFLAFEQYFDVGITLTSSELLVLGLCFGLLIGFFRQDYSLSAVVKTASPFVPFVVWLAITAVFAESRADAVKDVARWLSFFAIYVVSAAAVKREHDARRLALFLVAASVPAVLYGLSQPLLGPASAAFELEPFSRPETTFWLTIGGLTRARSVFHQANNFACYLLLVAPLALLLAVHAKTKGTKIAASVIFCLHLTAIMLTFSRVSWPLTVLSLVTIWALTKTHAKRRVNPKLLLLPAIGILVILIAVGFGVFRGSDYASLVAKHSGHQRLDLYRFGAGMLRERPILGVGPGNYCLAASRIDTEMSHGAEKLKQTHLHSLYLHTAVEAGLPGLALLLFFVFTVGLKLAVAARSSAPGEARWMATALFVGAASFFAYNLIDTFRFHSVHLVAATLMGAGVGLAERTRSGSVN